jgi:ADP-ribose pyrophosphatase YjhB (NUDIX family)
VFVREPQGRFLFFRRTGFPFAFTVPSGHVNVGEEAASAASREVLEETGIRTEALVALGVHDLVGDSCWRGSDAHRWHAFLATAPRVASVAVLEEGECARWLTLGETAH